MSYWVDDFGYVWKGPLNGDWHRFEGLDFGGSPIWVLRASEQPDDLEQMSLPRFEKFLLMFREEARK